MYNPDVTIYDDAYTYTIEEGEASQRIDRFVASLLEDVSRTSVQQIIVDGGVLVNGRTCKPSYLLRVGDEVCIAQTTAKSNRNARPCALPLNIVYEDKDLLVVNKAAGMVVHPSPGHVDDTLVNAVLAYYPDLQYVEGLRPGIVHRLDRDTSGLIIVAKNARTQDETGG